MRAAFDRLISWTGLVLAVVLLAAGGLLTWASSFVADQVNTQFVAQDITMPTEEALAAQLESGRLSQENVDALTPFAGEVMLTGPAAKAYAENYITAHMHAGAGTLATTLDGFGVDVTTLESWKAPLTYEAAGAVATEIQDGKDKADLSEDEATAIAAVNTFRSETLFKGNTLVGLLLYGYAFATIGTIAGIAAIAAFVGGGLLVVLTVLGFWHARKNSATDAEAAKPAKAAKA